MQVLRPFHSSVEMIPKKGLDDLGKRFRCFGEKV